MQTTVLNTGENSGTKNEHQTKKREEGNGGVGDRGLQTVAAANQNGYSEKGIADLRIFPMVSEG